MKTLFALWLLLLPLLSAGAGDKGEKFDLTIRWQIRCDTACRRYRMVTAMPTDMEGRQRIDGYRYSRTPDSVYTAGGVMYMVFDISNPRSYEQIFVRVTGELFKSDYATLRKRRTDTPEDLSVYLQPEKWIESDSAEILEQAGRLAGENTEQTLKKIYRFVNTHCRYVSTRDNLGAVAMLRGEEGDCTEFTDLFVALCRASGIPARHAYGINLLGFGDIGHSWAEVYVEPCGWVMFDPTPGNDAVFKQVERPYVWFSRVRNDNELNGYLFDTYTYWGTPVRVKTTYLLKTE